MEINGVADSVARATELGFAGLPGSMFGTEEL
jgi:hypothetical protein